MLAEHVADQARTGGSGVGSAKRLGVAVLSDPLVPSDGDRVPSGGPADDALPIISSALLRLRDRDRAWPGSSRSRRPLAGPSVRS